MRPDRLTRLGATTLSVPDPSTTASFLTDGLGMVAHAGTGGRIHVTSDGDYGVGVPHRAITLEPGASAGLAEISFDTHSSYDMPALTKRLTDRSIEYVELDHDDDGGPGIRFVDPWGLRVAIRRPSPVRAELLRGGGPLRPRRLGHVNTKVPSPQEAAAFYIDVLNLLLSERVGDAFWFLRVHSEHHNLAFRFGAASSEVHHVALEVAGFETYRPLLDHLADHGVRAEYGPGRHAPGRNMFVYIVEPSSGLRFELFSDMAHIYDEEAYVVKIWGPDDRPKTVNRWGPFPPESFL